jgi:hypothetical protein
MADKQVDNEYPFGSGMPILRSTFGNILLALVFGTPVLVAFSYYIYTHP